jgi:uncharacterized membrane protein YqhA
VEKILGTTRYLIIIPILGLVLASAYFYIVGGIGLIGTLLDLIFNIGQGASEAHGDALPAEVEVVEYVHQFLIGTVLFITAAGFYQLFIGRVEFPNWLRIDSTEELETNLIGVTVVVLAVQFMGVVFTRDAEQLLRYGAGIALPIAALSLFVGLRTWSTAKSKRSEREIELFDKYGDELVEAKRRSLADEGSPEEL